MKMIAKKQIKAWKRQRGMTLIELLVAGVISLIAASGMVIVMASTLGTGTQTIQMARMTQEMRTAMQIMTRELRRANYHSNYMACYGNTDCLGAGALNIGDKIKEIIPVDNGDSDCLYFWYDRPGTAGVGASQVAAFRRSTVTLPSGDVVGAIQVVTKPDAFSFSDAKCNLPTDWTDITDPELIDVLTFNVDDTASILETINADGDTQNVERIALAITARLTPDASLPAWLQNNASRELREFITVRNHTTASP